jgi:uncharacterized protein
MRTKKLQASIRRITEDIVKMIHPLRIVLFGSAVSGRTTPDSDLDFLIVVPESERPEKIVDMLYTGLRNKPMPCDFLVVRPSTLRRHVNNPAMIYREISKHGKEIFAV